MSECAACHTPAEGVALIRAVEETGRIYLFAENYPYMAYNQEMRRLYREGTVGTFLYGEGEYVHPDSARTKAGRSFGWTTGATGYRRPTTARTRWRRSCTSPTRGR